MRLRQLQEDGAGTDFSQGVAQTLDKVGSLAKRAKDKLSGAYKGAADSIKKDVADAHKEAEAQRAAAEKEAGDKEASEKAAAKEADKARKKEVNASMETAATNLLLGDADPAPEDMEAIGDYDAADLQQFQNLLELMSKRLALTPKNMRQALRTFLNANDATDDRLNELMSELDDQDLDRIELSYMHGRNDGVNDLWVQQLTSDDIGESQGAIKRWLRQTSKINQARNDAAQGKKQYYTGSGLAKVLRGQLQIMDRRLKTLRTLAKGMEGKEIKDAAGAAKAAVDGKMKESLSTLRTLLENR